MIAGIVRGSLFSAALVAAGSAAAQDQPAAPETQQIVVTGKRSIDREIRDFVGALAETPVQRQLSRFEQSVCPTAIGLAPAQRGALIQRMRRVAEAAGIRVGEAKCSGNVVVVVTPDKRVFLKALREKKPEYFGDMSPSEIRKLLAQPGPAVAWQLRGQPLSARGTPIDVDPATGLLLNRTTEPASRLTPSARPQFDAAVVIVETRAVTGLTTTEVADYAAMRAYAGMDPSRLGDSAAPTILRVLEAPMGSAVPPSLTDWDLGYLRGLYQSPLNAYSGAQRAAIRREVARQVQGADAK
ncbi:hypothetical protein [Sphingomonas sp. UNC305MFCol5.2]|uniref:hypothetical protein n=1 Tax=Sphingomonas sp. UNC305MFCol5.2 TaxID=1449076 RepID=UPI0004A6C2ED|nr:hypothetical protein [Sphingomonas sp. UNC305MFCol5.2]